MIYRGHSLTAMLIAMGLSCFLLTIVISFYTQSQQQNKILMAQLQLQAELQRLLQLMAKDLRRTGFRGVSDRVKQANFDLFVTDKEGHSFFIGEMAQEHRGSCILFFYDLDSNGCLGTTVKSGVCSREGQNTAGEIERELFGYRLHDNMLETRLAYKNAVNQHCKMADCKAYLGQQACNGGGWADLADSQIYLITKLKFSPMADNKGVQIELAGHLRNFPHISYATSAVVPLINEERPW
ncbi:prepilin peptidase dependent protein B [Mesocricetibacter intestinalis]|uniref:Prepilin peptidase dependent protein B n=1 Tax=Mesocricetibacter intestinalis TaxID=1521930 RepID=A0A4R6VFW5_9PAST|nr:type II secretion system protein J [Mesocricetibacter intestinalis]TDQ59885.1 prepilin peptidase dependent protein B [Mesocricetibacter intestinalis]